MPTVPLQESYAEYMAGRCYVYQTALNLDLDSVGAPPPPPQTQCAATVSLAKTFQMQTLELESLDSDSDSCQKISSRSMVWTINDQDIADP